MERSFGRLTPKASDYLADFEQHLSALSPSDVAGKIRALVDAHDHWRKFEALSLNAAENMMSDTARRLLDSDLATRVTEGFPGDKDFPAHRQNRFIDEIEAINIGLLKRLFRARHVEWRPVSTSMANATLLFCLTEPGDTIVTQPETAGGNYSYNNSGPPKAAKLNVAPLQFIEDTFELDVGPSCDTILKVRPRMIFVGGSNILFPYPLGELRAAADAVGATLVYDAAHVSLFIAAGLFQNPLAEGAHILTFSTHKLLSGAVGGAILTNDDELADRILGYSFPTLIQTRDQNKYAATGHALAEMSAFGRQYAAMTVENAKALGRALEAQGFEVAASERGYTQTHQLFVLLAETDNPGFEDDCQRANLLVTRAQRMGSSDRNAVRLTTQEITRRGLLPKDMAKVASWLRRIIRDRSDPKLVAAEVRDLVSRSTAAHYSFDRPDGA